MLETGKQELEQIEGKYFKKLHGFVAPMLGRHIALAKARVKENQAKLCPCGVDNLYELEATLQLDTSWPEMVSEMVS